MKELAELLERYRKDVTAVRECYMDLCAAILALTDRDTSEYVSKTEILLLVQQSLAGVQK